MVLGLRAREDPKCKRPTQLLGGPGRVLEDSVFRAIRDILCYYVIYIYIYTYIYIYMYMHIYIYVYTRMILRCLSYSRPSCRTCPGVGAVDAHPNAVHTTRATQNYIADSYFNAEIRIRNILQVNVSLRICNMLRALLSSQITRFRPGAMCRGTQTPCGANRARVCRQIA